MTPDKEAELLRLRETVDQLRNQLITTLERELGFRVELARLRPLVKERDELLERAKDRDLMPPEFHQNLLEFAADIARMLTPEQGCELIQELVRFMTWERTKFKPWPTRET